MTVSTQVSKVETAGNASTTTFPTNSGGLGFYFNDDADVLVYLRNDLTGVAVLQTDPTHYSMTGAGNQAGGNCEMVTAPAVGETHVINHAPELKQLLDYIENGKFPAETHEKGLDRLTHICQSLLEISNRSLVRAEGSATTGSFFNAGSNRISNLSNPIDLNDADNLSARDTAIAAAISNAASLSFNFAQPQIASGSLVAKSNETWILPAGNTVAQLPNNPSQGDTVRFYADGERSIVTGAVSTGSEESTGTATAGSADNSLEDSAQAWTINEHAGKILVITGTHALAGWSARIISNTADDLVTRNSPRVGAYATGMTYAIYTAADMTITPIGISRTITGTADSGGLTTLIDATKINYQGSFLGGTIVASTGGVGYISAFDEATGQFTIDAQDFVPAIAGGETYSLHFFETFQTEEVTNAGGLIEFTFIDGTWLQSYTVFDPATQRLKPLSVMEYLTGTKSFSTLSEFMQEVDSALSSGFDTQRVTLQTANFNAQTNYQNRFDVCNGVITATMLGSGNGGERIVMNIGAAHTDLVTLAVGVNGGGVGTTTSILNNGSVSDADNANIIVPPGGWARITRRRAVDGSSGDENVAYVYGSESCYKAGAGLPIYTISGGVITLTGKRGMISIDTESGVSTDDLDSINGATHIGEQLFIVPADGTHDVVLKDAIGNLALAAHITMDNTEDVAHLIWNGTAWLRISSSNNGA